jgi:hypothetical protein
MTPEERLEGHVEELHEDLAYVVTNPLLEYVDQEPPVLPAPDGAIRDDIAGLRVEQPLSAFVLM